MGADLTVLSIKHCCTFVRRGVPIKLVAPAGGEWFLLSVRCRDGIGHSSVQIARRSEVPYIGKIKSEAT